MQENIKNPKGKPVYKEYSPAVKKYLSKTFMAVRTIDSTRKKAQPVESDIIAFGGLSMKNMGWTEYNPEKGECAKLKKKIKELLLADGCSEAITDMYGLPAFAFANAVLELKKNGMPIKLTIALPCLGAGDRYSKLVQDIYRKIISQADDVMYITKQSCWTKESASLTQEYMLSRSDALYALGENRFFGNLHYLLKSAEENDLAVTILEPEAFMTTKKPA